VYLIEKENGFQIVKLQIQLRFFNDVSDILHARRDGTQLNQFTVRLRGKDVGNRSFA
jgi:hypothetical protein